MYNSPFYRPTLGNWYIQMTSPLSGRQVAFPLNLLCKNNNNKNRSIGHGSTNVNTSFSINGWLYVNQNRENHTKDRTHYTVEVFIQAQEDTVFLGDHCAENIRCISHKLFAVAALFNNELIFSTAIKVGWTFQTLFSCQTQQSKNSHIKSKQQLRTSDV